MKVLPQNCHQSDSRTTLFVRQLKCWRGGEVKGTNALSLPEVHPGNRMIGNRQYRVEGNGSSKVASSSSCRQIVWNEIRMYLSDKSENSLSLSVFWFEYPAKLLHYDGQSTALVSIYTKTDNYITQQREKDLDFLVVTLRRAHRFIDLLFWTMKRVGAMWREKVKENHIWRGFLRGGAFFIMVMSFVMMHIWWLIKRVYSTCIRPPLPKSRAVVLQWMAVIYSQTTRQMERVLR
jgi:hypothetical protein